MKRRLVIWVMIALGAVPAFSQVALEQLEMDAESQLQALPVLTLPDAYRFKSLPTTLDNTAKEYFPEVFAQYGYSCNQASSIGFVLTYELNAKRGASSAVLKNLYPPLSIWNLLNNADYGKGVSFFDSWEAVRKNGVPNYEDFGEENYAEKKWMTGYDKYHRGMHNRISRMFTIETHTEEGIQTLKHWLKDRLDGSPHGGLASFQIGSDGMKMQVLPQGEAGEGTHLLWAYGPVVGHAMTVVGYDDAVRWDYNNDGQYTNDVDLNDDGIIDVRDWEIGAFLVVNSWGEAWGTKGRTYVPYRLFALEPDEGGIWESCVNVVNPLPDYVPQLTYKLGMSYTKRTQLKIVAGVSTDLTSDRPQHVIEFPFFNYIGGYLPMQGVDAEGSEFIEIGLDVSPLLEFVEPNQQAKYFVEVYHQQFEEVAGQGEVNYFSVLDYGLEQVVETASPITNEKIKIDAVTRLYAFHQTHATVPEISGTTLPQAEVGVGYIHRLSASGGVAPYTYSHRGGQYQAFKRDDAWEMPGDAEKLLGISDGDRLVVELGFTFTFYGKDYDQVVLLKDGGLVLGNTTRDYKYVVDKRLFAYQNPGIYPLFGDLEYGYIGDGIYRKDLEDGVIFAWDATLSKYTGFYDPKFGIRLYTNGQFSFGFNTVALTPEWDWISVVSAGDQVNYTLTDMNHAGLWRGKSSYDFRLFDWPDWLFLTETGSMLGTPPATATSLWLPLVVTDANGTAKTSALFLDVAGGMGVDQPAAISDIRVYPNPVTTQLFVELGDASEDTVVEVFRADGQMVERRVIAAGERSLSLDVSRLSPGVYYVRVGTFVQAIVR